MLMALTREISAAFQSCELTHVERVSIDIDRARAQHAAYEWALVEAGCTVRRLDSGAGMPDAVFVEDIAVVLDEGAVICRPGATSRRAETPGVLEALARHGRPLQHIKAPGTLEGGDVLTIGRQVFVGASTRTNRAGIDQLVRILEPVGYAVRAVPVRGCLHLKSAVTALAPETVLINREWVPADAFAACRSWTSTHKNPTGPMPSRSPTSSSTPPHFHGRANGWNARACACDRSTSTSCRRRRAR